MLFPNARKELSNFDIDIPFSTTIECVVFESFLETYFAFEVIEITFNNLIA